MSISVFLDSECNELDAAESELKEGLVELQQTTTKNAANDAREYSPAASPRLRYYMHDHSHAFRLQLVGNFSEIDVSELDGCWTTACRSVAERKVCIDLRRVTGMDAAARTWLSEMSRNAGVEFIAPPSLAFELPESSVLQLQTAEALRPSQWQRLMQFFFRERRPVSHGMGTADVPAPLMRRSETQVPAA